MKVLIVGGGPVGLATAIHARIAGMEAHVFDRQTAPIDKACGEGLMPGGVEALKKLGVEVPTTAQAFRGIRYLQEDQPEAAIAEGVFSQGHGLGIRRLELHQALVDRAHALGAQLHWGCAATGLSEHGIQTAQGEVEGHFIIGADGLYSPTQKWAGLYQKPKAARRYGLHRHYRVAPWTGFVEVYWSLNCEAYITPTGPDTVGVALLWRSDRHRPNPQDPLAPFPRLSDRLQDSPFASHSRGAGPLARSPIAVQRGRVLLVGDAAGYVDAITGEGLSLGFHQAEAAIQAIAIGDPKTYRRAHKKQVRRPFFITRQLCWVAQRPRLRQRLIGGLSKDPVLFSRSLDLMEGHKGWGVLGLGRVLRLIRRLIWP